MDEDSQQLLEKSKEVGYTRINFSNQLKVLALEKMRLLKQIANKRDLSRIEKIKKEINAKI